MSAPVPTVPADDTLAVLKAAREWLSDPEHWTTRVLWRGASGHVLAAAIDDVYPDLIPKCAKTCASGALALVTGGAWPNGASDALTAQLPGAGIVPTNDGEDGYARILAAYDKAIADYEARA